MSLLDLLPLTVGAVTNPPTVIDVVATFLAALSGAIFAVERKFAVTGVLAIAIATGIGGGIMRDVLLQTPPVAFTELAYMPTAIVAAFVGFFFISLAKRGGTIILVLDPIWMGLFAVIGAQKAMNADLNALAAMLIGCMTAFGGGILRDLLSNEMPELVKPGPINYLAAILGSMLYVSLVRWAHVDKVVAEWATIAFVFGLRMLSLKFGIRAPQPVDLPAKLPGVAVTQANRRRRRRRDGGGA
jgi:uncharacterized membrane protein YeiH